VDNLKRDFNIANSRSITNARILKMQQRSEHIKDLKEEMLNELRDLRVNDRDRYLGTLKNLILQSMVRMLEDEIHVKCREEDKEDIEGMCEELQTTYMEFMQEKTGRDEYSTNINIVEDDYLTADEDQDCGGVVVFNSEKTIVCKNMIVSRLKQTFEECLPAIRSGLFPGQR
jgi:V-type H+-transporting ATPase subunit E